MEEDRQLNYLRIEFYKYENMEKGITERDRQRSSEQEDYKMAEDNHEG